MSNMQLHPILGGRPGWLSRAWWRLFGWTAHEWCGRWEWVRFR